MTTKTAEVELFLTSINDDIKIQTAHSRARQHFAVLVANLAAVCSGAVIGWTVPVLQLPGQLANATVDVDPEDPLELSGTERAWALAAMPVGALLGALPAGFLADRLGRKRVLMTVSLPFLAGWLLLLFAESCVWLLYPGRFLSGVAVGATGVLAPLYSSEITEDGIRGALGCYFELLHSLGALLALSLGALLPYFWHTLAAAALPLLFLATFPCMPESPTSLVVAGRLDAARRSLLWLRGGSRRDCEVQSELDSLVATVKNMSDEKVRKSFLIFCSKRPFRSTTARAVALVICLMFFRQFSGFTAVGYLTADIFAEAGSRLPGPIAHVVVAAVQAAATLGAVATVDHVGRRALLLLSELAMALSLAAFALYAGWDSAGWQQGGGWGWLPLGTLQLYVVAFGLGLGPLPWLLTVELLPLQARGWAGAMAVSCNWKVALGLTEEFPLMLRFLGPCATYGTLSVLCAAGALFVALFLPETRRRSHTEIQELIGGDRP